MTLSLLPFILPREFTNDGKTGSGFKIYTYQSGTNTPKQTFKKADGSELNTNPIICDASGYFTCFLDTGAYRIKVTDNNDVQIQSPIDGIVGGSGSGLSTETVEYLETYNALRSLTTTPDLVYVAGRISQGDGGAGFFQLLPGSSLTDDDCIILTSQSGSKVYRRIFDGVIDPQWRGLKYAVAIDQKLVVDALAQLSVKYGIPVLFTDSVYINQNTSIPSGAIFDMSDNGYFNSTLSTAIQFSAGSKFSATGRSFGVTVNPYFDTDTVDVIRLSWMAGNVADERLQKLFNSAVNYYIKMVVDETVTVAAGTWSCYNPISFESGSIISFTVASNLNLTMTKIEAEPIKILEIPGTVSVAAMSFGDNPAYIEWFGGIGNDSNDDSFPLYQAAMSGNVKTVRGKTYKIGAATPPSYPSAFSISGDGVIKLYSTKTLGTGAISLQDVTIQTPTPHIWFAGTSLTAINATFPSTYTATTSFIDGCIYSDDARFPVYGGAPAIYNGYLPLLPNSGGLGTTSTGKIIDVTTPITLVSGVDVNISVLNIGWITGGVYSASAKIYPITQKMAKLVVAIEMDGGVPPVSPTTDFAAIDIGGITSAAAYWLGSGRGPCFEGKCDLALRYDTQSVYPVTVPAGVWDINASGDPGSRYVFGGSYGVNNQYSGYHNSQTTPNPHMGWGNIFTNVTYPNANNVRYFIGFSVTITRL